MHIHHRPPHTSSIRYINNNNYEQKSNYRMSYCIGVLLLLVLNRQTTST